MNYTDEVRRKSIHLGSAAFALLYWATDREVTLWVLGTLLAIAVVLETLRLSNEAARLWFQRWLGGVMRDFEQGVPTGATFVTVAYFLSVLLFPKHIAITAMLFLAVSDSAASLVGRSLGRPMLWGKSPAGSAAFFVSAALIVLVTMPERILLGWFGAVVGTVAEALPGRIGPVRLDDNLLIPLVSGAAMWAFL